MKHNLEHFSEIMEKWQSQITEEMRTEDKFLKLASHKGEDVASKPVQNIVEEILTGALASAPNLLIGSTENYCRIIMDTYSNDYLSKVMDTQYGAGSSEYIVKAFAIIPKITSQKTIRAHFRAKGHKSTPELPILSAFPGFCLLLELAKFYLIHSTYSILQPQSSSLLSKRQIFLRIS